MRPQTDYTNGWFPPIDETQNSRRIPVQKPGRSKQDYRTPKDFLSAAKDRLKIDDFTVDLAADSHNAVAPIFFDIEMNSLVQPWSDYKGWLWCNPPYANIEPWAEKAATESLKGAHIVMLIPASVGANWWKQWVEPHSYQLFLNGRITFQGCTTPYPKDTALLIYTPFIRSGNAVWNWRTPDGANTPVQN